jgi:hypothetical protein
MSCHIAQYRQSIEKPYFPCSKTLFLPQKMLHKICLHLMVQMCINMTLKANEIPTFAEGTAVVITRLILEGRQTAAFCLALTI